VKKPYGQVVVFANLITTYSMPSSKYNYSKLWGVAQFVCAGFSPIKPWVQVSWGGVEVGSH